MGSCPKFLLLTLKEMHGKCKENFTFKKMTAFLSWQEIGWKNKEDARRVVVLTTDAAYHFAGDGLVRVLNARMRLIKSR